MTIEIYAGYETLLINKYNMSKIKEANHVHSYCSKHGTTEFTEYVFYDAPPNYV